METDEDQPPIAVAQPPTRDELPAWLRDEIEEREDRRSVADDTWHAHKRTSARRSAVFSAVAGLFLVLFVGSTAFLAYVLAAALYAASGWVIDRLEASTALGAIVGGVTSVVATFLVDAQVIYAFFGWLLGAVIGAIVALRAQQVRSLRLPC